MGALIKHTHHLLSAPLTGGSAAHHFTYLLRAIALALVLMEGIYLAVSPLIQSTYAYADEADVQTTPQASMQLSIANDSLDTSFEISAEGTNATAPDFSFVWRFFAYCKRVKPPS